MMKTPWEAFIQWFDGTPLIMRKYLAHVFRVCTTEDTTRLVCSPEVSLEDFRVWAVKMDFPLRIAARLFYVRSIFDMVIFHYKEIFFENDGLPDFPVRDIPVQLSSKQWEEVLNSWSRLRTREMSDAYIHSWTSVMIKLQTEAC
jgi:hypothetical protein